MITDTYNSIAIMILAAGESTRMGEPKQLLPWKNTTLLGHVVTMAKSVCDENVLVVLGANYNKIRELKELEGANLIFNPEYKTGQGSSLSTGINYLLKQEKKHEGLLILLCDQPLITTEYLNTLTNAFFNGKKGIVATDYGKKAGVPAIFHSKYFDVLKNIEGDKGAKSIITENRADVLLYNPEGKEMDIDTKEDYENFLADSN